MLAKLRSMILHCRTTKVSDDTETYPSVQVSYLGKVADVTRIVPYPLVGNPTINALGIKMNIGASEGNRVAIMHDPKNRLKGLKEGEGGLFNALTKDHILLLDDGISILSNGTLDIEITGDVNLTVNGNVNLVAQTTNVTGNVNIDGDLTVTGDSTATDHISGGISGNSHVHGGVQSGGSTTLVPQ